MCRLYRTTSHTKYDLKYHLVWITKYRRAVLSGVVGTRVRELVREICRANDIGIGNRHATVCHVAGLFVLRPAAALLVELSLPSRRRSCREDNGATRLLLIGKSSGLTY